jgi:hypothetical protein
MKASVAFLRSILVFVALVVFGFCYGQPYFSRLYPGLRLVRGTITPDSGLVVCGGGGAAASADYAGRWLMRLDRYGIPLWYSAYNAGQQDAIWIRDVTWLGDTSFLIVGYLGTEWTTSNSMVLQVVGPTGEVSWGGRSGGGSSGNTANRLTRAVRAPDGSAIVGGVFLTMNLSGVLGSGYALRVGVDPNSYSEPIRTYSGDWVSIFQNVTPTADGGYLCVGDAGSYTMVVKVSDSGSVVLARRIFTGTVENSLMYVVEGEGGSIYLALESYGFFRLTRMELDGNVSWSKKFTMPGEDKPTGLVRFPNGDLWISGSDWLMACTGNGDVLWARGIPHLILDMEAAPEADGVFLIGRDGNDGWVMRTDVYGQVPGCADSSFVPTITPENLVPTSLSTPLSNSGLSAYVASVISGVVPTTVGDCIATAVDDDATNDTWFHMYPVPFTDVLNVDLPRFVVRLELVDVHGSILRSINVRDERSIMLRRDDLSSGLYLLRAVLPNAQVAIQRVIVE